MKRNDEHECERLLHRELRGEALESRPEFSATLHAQLLTAIRGQPVASATPALAKGGRRRRAVSWVLAAAASIALAAVLVLAWHHLPDNAHGTDTVASDSATQTRSNQNRATEPANATVGEAPRSGDLDAAAEEVANSTAGLDAWLQSTADESQWAGLDRDAQSALAAVAGPLPFDLTFALASDEGER